MRRARSVRIVLFVSVLAAGQFPIDQHKSCQLTQEGNEPGYGIGREQTLGGMESGKLENGENPAGTDAHNAQYRDQHGDKGGTQPPEGTGGNIHQAADKIGQADIAQTDHTVADSFGRIRNVNGQQLRSHGPDQGAQTDAHPVIAL